LTAGEAALGIALYWMAYELIGSQGKSALGAKVTRFALPCGILLVYLVGYKLANFGSANNAAYFEPLSDTKGFVVAMAQRIPVMLGEMFLGTPSALAVAFSPVPFVVTGLFATAAVVGLVSAAWRVVPEDERRGLGWLALGAAASLVVSVGGFPGSRLLLVPSVGGAAIVGAILCHGWTALGARGITTGIHRTGWLVLFAVHVVVAPLMFFGMSGLLAKIAARTAEIDVSLDGALPAPGSPAKPPIAFLIASDPLAGVYVGAARAVRAPGTVSGWSVLSSAHATHDIRRTDDRTLVIETDRPMLKGAFDGVFRDPARLPLKAGDRVELDDVTVTVVAAAGGYPSRIEVRFEAPLEDERYRLLAWQDGRLAPLQVSIGEHVVIPWTPGPTGFF
jgi:hypothetical protein